MSELFPNFEGAVQKRLKKALMERPQEESPRQMSDRLYKELQTEGMPLAPESEMPVFVYPDFSNIEVHLNSGRSIYANVEPAKDIKRRLEDE